MDISACTDLAFGQSNLRNQGLLETAPVWGSHTSRASHDFSLFSAGYVGGEPQDLTGKMQDSNLLPREVPLFHRGTQQSFQTNHTEVQQPSTRLCSAWFCREGETCCTIIHTSVTRPNTHTHYAAYMQISSVCINCDVGFAASPSLFSITHLHQETGPAPLPFSPKWNPKLLLSTLSPATTATRQLQMLMVELIWQHSWKENLNASSNLSNRRKLQHKNSLDAAAYLLVSLSLSRKQVSPGHYCSLIHFQIPSSTSLPWIHTSPIPNTGL